MGKRKERGKYSLHRGPPRQPVQDRQPADSLGGSAPLPHLPLFDFSHLPFDLVAIQQLCVAPECRIKYHGMDFQSLWAEVRYESLYSPDGVLFGHGLRGARGWLLYRVGGGRGFLLLSS